MAILALTPNVNGARRHQVSVELMNAVHVELESRMQVSGQAPMRQRMAGARGRRALSDVEAAALAAVAAMQPAPSRGSP
jgi:hypothetical protein